MGEEWLAYPRHGGGRRRLARPGAGTLQRSNMGWICMFQPVTRSTRLHRGSGYSGQHRRSARCTYPPLKLNTSTRRRWQTRGRLAFDDARKLPMPRSRIPLLRAREPEDLKLALREAYSARSSAERSKHLRQARSASQLEARKEMIMRIEEILGSRRFGVLWHTCSCR